MLDQDQTAGPDRAVRGRSGVAPRSMARDRAARETAARETVARETVSGESPETGLGAVAGSANTGSANTDRKGVGGSLLIKSDSGQRPGESSIRLGMSPGPKQVDGMVPPEQEPLAVRPLGVELEALIRREVGQRSLASLHEQVRRSMLMEAMRRHGGNITQAARTLGLSRQAVQQMVAALHLKGWARQLRLDRSRR